VLIGLIGKGSFEMRAIRMVLAITALMISSAACFACENGDQKTSNDGRTLICICDRDGNCRWAGG
jgi:hypothetical protein